MDSCVVRKPNQQDIQSFKNKDDLICVIEYKNKNYPIFYDEYSSQYYIIIENKLYGGGALNSNYLEDFKYLIKTRVR